MGQDTRYCLYSPAGTPVAVSLFAGKNIIVGADFRIVSEDKTKILDSWKMTAENNKILLRTISSVYTKLNRSYLIWQMLFCSSEPSVHIGRIEIKVMQDGSECKMTLPVIYEPDNIPPCSINNPLKISGSLIFMAKS